MHSILMSTVKVRANEQESNSFELLQRQRERSVGCDEENFSSPEEKQLVALQPKLCDEVTNSQQSHPNSPPRLGGVPEGGGGRKTTNIQ